VEGSKDSLCATTPQKSITLMPKEQSFIVSGTSYKAASLGIANATILFNYGVQNTKDMPVYNDNTSRSFTFDIKKVSNPQGSTFHNATHFHIKGVKLLQVHTYPPLVTNGNSFVIRALVFNNSTSAITFLNGTCNQSVHINFNKNVEGSKDSLCATTPQKSITLMPKEQSFIVSGTSYKAASLGIANATILFNYGVQNTKDMPVYNDNTSRSFTFDIKKVSNPQGSTFHNATHFHIKGVKLLHIRTNPTKVYLGTVFSLNAMALNNSTSTISLANGTCLSPMFISFNSNVLHENQTSSNKCKVQPVLLKPGAQIPVFSSNLSKPTFKATSAGVANGTITFKYKVLAPPSKSFINDSISRIFSLKIQNKPSAASLKK
jgi:hypothetical protein